MSLVGLPPGLFTTWEAQRQGEPVQTDSGFRQNWKPAGTVEAAVPEATYRELMLSAQVDHTITHTVIHQGPPVLSVGDRFRKPPAGGKPERLLYVNGVDDAGELGLWSRYTVEERRPG